MDFLYFTSPPQTHTPSWSGSVLSFSRSPLVIFALPDTLTLLLLPPPPQYCVFSCLLLRSCNHVRVLCWSIITEPKIEWLNTIHIAYLAGSGGRGGRKPGTEFSLLGSLTGQYHGAGWSPSPPHWVRSASQLTQWVLAGSSALGWGG